MFLVCGGELLKTIEFDETQIGELKKIACKLFDDEFDPRSNAYKRVIVRPKVNWLGLLLWILIPILCVAILLFFDLCGMGRFQKMCIILALGVLYVGVTARWAAISIIKVYQRFAPESVRMKCRFEPSCSQYMVQAIKKYGLIKGAKRGMNRLGRCNINGGGFDEP